MTPQKVVTFKRWQVAAAFAALTLAYVAAAVVLAILAAGGAQAHDALCALRQERQKSVRVAKRFLVEHPNGFAGISAAVIRRGIRDQQTTIDTLKPLHCPDAVFD